jgi:hypothetical protein
MAAPIVAAAALAAAKLAAKKIASNAAKKSATKAATAAKKNLNKPVAKSNKPVVKITGVKANPKKVAPKSSVKPQKASQYTQDNLNKTRTPEGNRRAIEAARKAEQLRVAKAARRAAEIDKSNR